MLGLVARRKVTGLEECVKGSVWMYQILMLFITTKTV